MNEILGETLDDFNFVLLDDILTASYDFETHLIHLRKTLELLRAKGVCLNLSKCEFAIISLIYLGFVVDDTGLHADPLKIAAIKDWAVPKTKKDIRSFTGAVNYLRRFIPNCAHYTSCLADLTSESITTKDITKHWTTTHQAAFEFLKQAITTTPVLAFPDWNLPFIVETDASDCALSGVLAQKIFDEKLQKEILKPIAYYSRKFNSAQQNYDASNREALAIVASLEHFRHYILGRQVTVITDHWGHQTLLHRNDAHHRLARWRSVLQEFDLTITYRPGAQHHLADALSRLESDPETPTLPTDLDEYPVNIWNISTTEPTTSATEWASAQRADPRLAQLIQFIEKPLSVPGIKYRKWLTQHLSEFQLCDNILWRITVDTSDTPPTTTKAIAVPKSKIHQILTSLHDSLPDGGHLGTKIIYPKLREYFWWPNMYADLDTHITSCMVCQRYKTGIKKNLQFHSNLIVSERMEAVAIDALKLPLSTEQYQYVIVCVDIYSGFAFAIPVTDIKATSVYTALKSMVFTTYGYPKILISDGGSEFNNEKIDELCKIAGSDHRTVAPYHPQANSRAERFNKSLITLLATTATTSDDTDWPTRLYDVVHIFNCARNAKTGLSRFYIMHGYEPRPTVFTNIVTPNPNSDPDPPVQETLRQHAASSHMTDMEAQRLKQIDAANELRVKPVEWTVGQLIWITEQNTMSEHDRSVSKKLHVKWIGPYVVLEIKVKGAYIVRSLGSSVTTTRSAKHTKLCILGTNEPNRIPTQYLTRAAPQHESARTRSQRRPQRTQEDFEVEKITAHKWTPDTQLLFNVKWKGYPESESTWEPESNLECPTLVHNYFDQLALRLSPEDLSEGRRL